MSSESLYASLPQTVERSTVGEDGSIEVVTLYLGADPAWAALRDCYPHLEPRPYETLVLSRREGDALSPRSWRSSSREEAQAIHEHVALLVHGAERSHAGSAA